MSKYAPMFQMGTEYGQMVSPVIVTVQLYK